MTDDLRRRKIEAHGANLKRYARLLTTRLTDLERAFLHKRIAEERLAMERLLSSPHETTSRAGQLATTAPPATDGRLPGLR